MTLLSVEEATARLLALADPVATETVSLGEAAGRWAAEDIPALRTQPERDLSSMDGYAIRFADLPGPFRVIGESAAGRPFAGTVAPGEAVRIFTGAATPEGTDTVMVQEEAAREGDTLTLAGEGPGRAGRNVRPKGLDFTTGDLLVARGERLSAPRIALAATGGHGALPVRRRIRVAIAATGDELVPPGTPVAEGSLPEGNSAMLAAMLADLPVALIPLGILPDRLDAITAAFASVDADVLVTTGGASVGDHDLVRPALEAAGGSLDFWRIALRPGKPMLAGRLNGTIVLGLPGNPVSAFVTGSVFLRPLIAHLGGAADTRLRTQPAILGEDLPANDHRMDFLRAETRDGRVHVAAIQDSSMLRTLARADCLVLRAPRAPKASAGDSVEILRIA
ncbi:molybdopterin molybdotransferase MoeA [Sphingomonas immobilis]|uniref:Molybdopterin molybdenumtransferase n=1 Tax=Sphingomonas immobilis TaxID=3063997 RepID=A0ABT8ZUA2_9SPHN|nr:molybdopterin molybdotransferase MoeA [Sphingomonas sp. CA1-15]MDO7841152.1 molybdopterin molybdotransferase MoeA [Sphingomonas sp. CA1-15]